MKNWIWLWGIVYLFNCNYAYSQGNGKYVHLKSSKKENASLIWLNTKVEKNNKVILKAKIFASFPIEASAISMLINDKKEGSKAQISSLYGNAEHEYTYERTINLPYVSNNLQLVLKSDSLEYFSSILQIKENKVTILDDGDYNSRILWIYPDPAKTEGHSYRSESSLFHYSVLIKTGITLNNKNSIQIILNDIIHKPKQNDILRKTGYNQYEFQGTILLERNIDVNEISLRLKINDNLVESKPYSITLDEDQPSLYLLSIGTLTNLDFTSKDAKDFADVYSSQGESAGIFQSVNIELLNGIDATTNEIKGRIEELNIKKKGGIIKSKDLIILFISSHGFLHDNELRIQGDDYDPSRKRTTSVSFKEDIVDILKEIDCKKLVFVDACHSGGGEKSNIADLNFEIEKLNNIPSGITTFVSSQKDELSYEDDKWQNGAFTEAIIQGLAGGEADHDNNFIITIDELYSFLKKEVPKIVLAAKGKPQNPKMLSNDLGDVAIYFIN